MAIGYFLRVGDRTTCGGQILTGDNTFQFYGVAAAREGDMVTCGKHSGTYQMLGGISNVWDNGRKMAGTLDSFSSCPCKSRIINTINDCYAKEEQPAPRMAAAPIPQPEQAFTQPSSSPSSAMPFVPVVDNRIRIDAQQLMDCADEICEKHLYYPETKSEFKHDVAAFASTIVEEVESGQKSYEQGSAELKATEKDIVDQSIDWIVNGLSILGGLGIPKLARVYDERKIKPLVLYHYGRLMVGSTVVIAAPLQLDKNILAEKAAFSLGVQKDRVTIEESDRTPEKLTEYFNAIYKNKTYQCYVSHLNDSISDAVCRPTDGSDLPK